MSVQVQLRRDTYANVATNHGAAGEVFVDTTNQRLVVQDGATAGGFPAPVTLFVGNGGTTNNSNAGSGAFINHTPTFTLPANFMIAARAFRLTTHFQITTGTTVPSLTIQLALGATAIATVGLGVLPGSVTNQQFGLQWIFQATQAPSASSNIQATLGSVTLNALAMPVAVATNAAQALTIATKWATAGAGTNTIGLNQFILEALN
ncbi:MAG: hypothetical protein M3178_01425 [Pseudomonadota bacterium]|nr:hypothetical protein [Pseudomonadota bacterium]